MGEFPGKFIGSKGPGLKDYLQSKVGIKAVSKYLPDNMKPEDLLEKANKLVQKVRRRERPTYILHASISMM